MAGQFMIFLIILITGDYQMEEITNRQPIRKLTLIYSNNIRGLSKKTRLDKLHKCQIEIYVHVRFYIVLIHEIIETNYDKGN